jgi:hypothetical protein
VRELKPFKSLIRVFYRDEHMRSLLDEDVATFLGHATDELIRHHPDLKTDIMEAVKELVEEILKIGNSFIESVSTEELNKLPLSLHYGNDDDQTVEVKMVGADTKPDESKEISVLNYIDGMARVSR